jgi:hypothetical protein
MTVNNRKDLRLILSIFEPDFNDREGYLNVNNKKTRDVTPFHICNINFDKYE